MKEIQGLCINSVVRLEIIDLYTLNLNMEVNELSKVTEKNFFQNVYSILSMGNPVAPDIRK
jgi:hypothetical protein